jgi:hypothetical protein
MNLGSSYKLERKISDTGEKKEWRIENAQLRLQLQPTSYLRLEMAACKAFVNKRTRTNGSDNSNDEEGIFGTGQDSQQNRFAMARMGKEHSGAQSATNQHGC